MRTRTGKRKRAVIESLERRWLLSTDFQMLRDINSFPGVSQPGGNNFYLPPQSITVGGYVYYAHATGPTGAELWRTDGTPEGTELIKDIRPGKASSSPSTFTNIDGTIFFIANDGVHGTELWRTDGTAGG